MSLTTIPIEKETRDKLKEIAKKSESWNDLLNRLYDNAVASANAELFFSSDTLSLKQALSEIDKW